MSQELKLILWIVLYAIVMMWIARSRPSGESGLGQAVDPGVEASLGLGAVGDPGA